MWKESIDKSRKEMPDFSRTDPHVECVTLGRGKKLIILKVVKWFLFSFFSLTPVFCEPFYVHTFSIRRERQETLKPVPFGVKENGNFMDTEKQKEALTYGII